MLSRTFIAKAVLLVGLGLVYLGWPAIAPLAALPGGERTTELVRLAIGAVLWLVATSVLITLVNAIVWDRVVASAIGIPVPPLLRETSSVILYALALMALLSILFEQSIAGFWAASGALSIVLGLALRSIILDLFTGVAVSVERSYRIGDWVDIVDRTGPPLHAQVVAMNWRATRLQFYDKRTLIVPNSRMGLMMVVNYSLHEGPTRAEVMLTLEAHLPQERARRILLASVVALQGRDGMVMTPAPTVMVNSVGPDGVEYRIWFWHDVRSVSPAVARSRVLASALRHLSIAGPCVPRRLRAKSGLLGAMARPRTPTTRNDWRWCAPSSSSVAPWMARSNSA